MDINYLDKVRTQELVDETKNRLNKKEPLVFKGTQAEWDALTEDEQAVFTVRYHPDEGTGDVVDAVEDGNMKAVTSNAVYDAVPRQIYSNTFTVGSTLFTTPSAGVYSISIKAYVKAASDGDWNSLFLCDNDADFYHIQNINYQGGMYFDFTWCGYLGANHAISVKAQSGAGTPTIEQPYAWIIRLGN